ncbi:MAG: response regulator transcription factor [Flavobacteriales bacterium]|nr:response regulator transcription factor [Flavobacteriales bacterium]
MSTPIRVALVEDLPQMRAFLRNVIARAQDMELAVEYRSAEEAFPAITEMKLDVVISDIGLPGTNGIELLRKLRPFMPRTQFMVYTVHDDDLRVFEALKAGANAYMLKSSTPIAILEGVRELMQGGAPMSASVARRLVDHLRPAPTTPGNEHEELTPREQNVLDLLAQGLLYKEIAEREGLSISTVKAHIHSIYKKLHVGSREEAVERYGKRN